MKCADPVLCYIDAKGNKQYRHFSLATQIFKLMHQLVFDCGKCLFCRKKKAYELACRCVLHSSLYKDNCFLTLTYDEKKEGYHNELDYTEIQKFKKRLRQSLYPKKIEIFNVHEYGKNGKKHWHLVVFNHQFADRTLYTRQNGISLYTSKTLEKIWPFGFNTIGDVETASAMYAAQYMEKDIKNGNRTNGKASKSNHSGIGREYFKRNYFQILSLGFVPINGRKLPVPRYFQRIAHKHYCHFYEPSAFFDTTTRKKLYTSFYKEEPNKEMADLYIQFKQMKAEKIKELEKNWNDVISQHLTTKETPGFIKTNENALHDLKNSNHLERF